MAKSNASETRSFVVMWDFPDHAKSGLSTFYRRLRELLSDYGGSAHCRATRSAYIVEGNDAMQLAYAIAALASKFGAGPVGEQDGVVVLPLGSIPPDQHFAALRQAGTVVDALTADRRERAHKREPRGVQLLTESAERDDQGELPDSDDDPAGFWLDLSQFLTKSLNANDMQVQLEHHHAFDRAVDRETFETATSV